MNETKKLEEHLMLKSFMKRDIKWTGNHTFLSIPLIKNEPIISKDTITNLINIIDENNFILNELNYDTCIMYKSGNCILILPTDNNKFINGKEIIIINLTNNVLQIITNPEINIGYCRGFIKSYTKITIIYCTDINGNNLYI